MSKVNFIKRTLALGNHIPGFDSLLRFLFRREHKALRCEFAGISFPHPLGIRHGYARNGEIAQMLTAIGFSYIGIDVYDYDALKAIRMISSRNQGTIINACLATAIEGKTESEMQEQVIRSFSLIYDFVDLVTIEVATDIFDIVDEVLSQRLCYEKHVPILVRIPDHQSDNIHNILDFCLISGIDGIVAPGVSMVRSVIEYTKGRIPVIGSGDFTDPEEAADMLRSGAVLLECGKGFESFGYKTPEKILRALGKASKI